MENTNTEHALEIKEKSPYKQRFSDAAWFEKLKGTYILLLGSGGIGSWVALCLSRIGCNFTVADMDRIEPHNLGGQFYNMDTIGLPKTTAIKQLCEDFSGNENTIRTAGEYTESSYTNPIVIAAFDNMRSRKLAFQKWKEAALYDPNHGQDYLFLDGRLLAEDYQVYAVTVDRMDKYEKTLRHDDEIPDAPCSLQSTTHCALGIASDIISCLTNFITNSAWDTDLRELPFKIVKSIPSYTYEISDH